MSSSGLVHMDVRVDEAGQQHLVVGDVDDFVRGRRVPFQQSSDDAVPHVDRQVLEVNHPNAQKDATRLRGRPAEKRRYPHPWGTYRISDAACNIFPANIPLVVGFRLVRAYPWPVNLVY